MNKINLLKENEVGQEWCTHCEGESRIQLNFIKQSCEHCNKTLLPCSLCIKMDCDNCPIAK